MLVLLLLLLSAGPTPEDEQAVTAAALEAYFNQIHGGTGIAFPAERRPVLLHRMTIVPSRTQLTVRVFSPANGEGAQRYAAPETGALVASLRARSARPAAVRIAPPHYSLSSTKVGDCGPEFDERRYVNAAAVSRPGFDRRDRALVYVAFAGEARAYVLMRTNGQWNVAWFVELWACG